jgi:hypothetical protein
VRAIYKVVCVLTLVHPSEAALDHIVLNGLGGDGEVVVGDLREEEVVSDVSVCVEGGVVHLLNVSGDDSRRRWIVVGDRTVVFVRAAFTCDVVVKCVNSEAESAIHCLEG